MGRDASFHVCPHIAYGSYHDLTILTYDHVLDRARRMLAAREDGRQLG